MLPPPPTTVDVTPMASVADSHIDPTLCPVALALNLMNLFNFRC